LDSGKESDYSGLCLAASGDFTAYQTTDGGTDGGSAPGIRDESGGDTADDRAGGLAAADVRVR
jgi:hypothetical protein